MDLLIPGDQFGVGGSLTSANGSAILVLQADGNLVLQRTSDNAVLWASGTNGHPVDTAIMQTAGNFVLYAKGGIAVWAMPPNALPGAYLTLQDDGNLVIYAPGPVETRHALWATNTTSAPLSTIPPRRADLGDGHFMVTTAQLNHATLEVSFVENMTCTNKISGFTGGVLLTYIDEDNKVIGNSGVQQNGIDQAPLFGASHRAVTWNGTAPNGTAGILLAQFWDPKNRLVPALGDIGNAFLAFAQSALDVGLGVPLSNSWSADWCAQNPGWCTAMDVIGLLTGLTGLVLIELL